jgi:hypothetical protein
VTYSLRTACTTAWVKGDTLGIEAGIVDIDALKEEMDVFSTVRKLMAFLSLCVFGSHVDRIGKRPPRSMFAMFARETGLDFTSTYQ